MTNANQLPITSEILNAACAALAAKRAEKIACIADQAAANAWALGQLDLAAAGKSLNAAKAAKGKATKAERQLQAITRAAVLAAHPELSADRVKVWTLAISLENAATALAVLEA